MCNVQEEKLIEEIDWKICKIKGRYGVMKKIIVLGCEVIFIFLIAGCKGENKNSIGNDEVQTIRNYEIQTIEVNEYDIDYIDAESFENALNDGKKVNGMIVQFNVLAYKPDSALGINCWSGEHLNFISEIELDVQEGDIVVGRIVQEPSKTLGSWEIHYEVIEINPDTVNNEELITQKLEVTQEQEAIQEEVTQEQEVIEEQETGEEVETIVAPSSEYEKAYVRELSNYTLYIMFDEDTNSVVSFGTNDTYVMKGSYSGSFSSGIIICWDDGWDETFKDPNGNIATLIDGNGYDWIYEVCEVDIAQNVLDALK